MLHSCRNVPGSFQCSCPDGLVGDPVHTGCRKPGDCGTDVDCPPSASCIDNRCRNPCDSPASCGVNAECTTINHSPQCRCPPQTRGDAKVNLRSHFHKNLHAQLNSLIFSSVVSTQKTSLILFYNVICEHQLKTKNDNSSILS